MKILVKYKINILMYLLFICGMFTIIFVDKKVVPRDRIFEPIPVRKREVQKLESRKNETIKIPPGISKNFIENNRNISCYGEKNNLGSLKLFDFSQIGDNNIFFHETSCFETSEIILNPRQACAVESAAKMNPNTRVYLLYLSPSKLSNKSKKLYKNLMKYPNIKIERILISDYVKNTPLEKWYNTDPLKSSLWPTSHMSDILRYLTLWKFGGIYLDLDVIVIKSLEDLSDFVGAQDSENVAAGVMGFSKLELGRRMANECLIDLMNNFQGDVWGNNGPGVITRILKRKCGVNFVKFMTVERCEGFKVFSPAMFYPIPFFQWQKYFQSENLEIIIRLLSQARAIHVWNKLSRHHNAQEISPYRIIASRFCPQIYKHSPDQV